MRRVGKWVSTTAAAAGAAVLLAAAPASAQGANVNPPERPLSLLHTTYGPSQMWVGDSTTFREIHLRVSNPTIREQMVAVLAYDRVNEGRGEGEAEVFENCYVQRLTPHGSIAMSNVGGRGRFYGEVIAAPARPVRLPDGSATRLANGLGVVVRGGGSRESQPWQAIFPRIFTLPSNAVVAGQRGRAISCVCAHLAFLFKDVPSDVFSDFGINCSQ